MSLMHLTCPWCGCEYRFGIVGSEMIGGHSCDAVKHCDTNQCPAAAKWLVEDVDGATAFTCTDHIGDRIVLQSHSQKESNV